MKLQIVIDPVVHGVDFEEIACRTCYATERSSLLACMLV